jgi:hypothetical protein
MARDVTFLKVTREDNGVWIHFFDRWLIVLTSIGRNGTVGERKTAGKCSAFQ